MSKLFTPKKERNVVVEEVTTEELVTQFMHAFNIVGERFIDRGPMLDAIRLAVLTGEHVLIEGLHGLAKSAVCECIFDLFKGEDDPANVFTIQFSAGTLPEAVWGPMSIKALREEDKMVYNTDGMMPQAHFAFLDELTRAGKSVLPTMMSLLNERTFHNGGERQECPLLTAVAAVNFNEHSEELAAFMDRFLFHVVVRPVEGVGKRIDMLSLVSNQPRWSPPEQAMLDLSSLARLRKAVNNVTLPEIMLNSMVAMVNSYERDMNGANTGHKVYISDRRLCKLVKVVKAHALTKGRDIVTEEDFTALRSCLLLTTVEHTKRFDKALGETVKELSAYSTKHRQGLDHLRSEHNSSLLPRLAALKSASKASEEFDKLDKQISKLEEFGPDERYPDCKLAAVEFTSLLNMLKATRARLASTWNLTNKAVAQPDDETEVPNSSGTRTGRSTTK